MVALPGLQMTVAALVQIHDPQFENQVRRFTSDNYPGPAVRRCLSEPTRSALAMKSWQQEYYYACALSLIAGLYLSVIQNPKGSLFGIQRPVFLLESVGIIAFSVSWLTKGKTIAGLGTLRRRITG